MSIITSMRFEHLSIEFYKTLDPLVCSGKMLNHEPMTASFPHVPSLINEFHTLLLLVSV